MIRLTYIDCLRGAMILFVVYYHVLWLGVKYVNSPSKDVFDLMCMQVFFFLSGFVSVKQFDGIGWKQVLVSSLKKCKTLLIPSLLMFTFCCLYYRLDIVYYLYNEFKTGYWFTYILFLIFVLHNIVCYITGKIKINKVVIDGMTLFIGVYLYYLSPRIYILFPYESLRFLSLQFLFKYYFFFIMGYLTNKYLEIYEMLSNNRIIKSVILIVALAPFIGRVEVIVINRIVELFISISIVFVIFELFRKINIFNCDNFVSRQLSLFGKHSMEIYFLHYYFVFNLPFALSFIMAQQNYCFRSGGNVLLPELLVVFPVAILLSYLSMGVRKIIDFSPLISKWFLGPIHN